MIVTDDDLNVAASYIARLLTAITEPESVPTEEEVWADYYGEESA